MLRVLALAVALSLGLLSGVAASAQRVPPKPRVIAELSRAKQGWLLTYRFKHAAPAWFFPHSNPASDGKSWRLRSWTVETPGVRLERDGRYDVLVSADGSPLKIVRIRVTPFGEHLQAEYQPFLNFSDGGAAIYSEHYEAAPLKSAAEALALPADLANYELTGNSTTRLTVSDPGHPLLILGRKVRGRASRILGNGGAYIYTGTAAIIDMPAFSGVIDPNLPAWVRTELSDFTPKLMAFYAERLGPPAGGRPVAYVSWGGPAAPGVSLGGSVLTGTVVLDIKGADVANPTPRVTSRMRWFCGHESAHFWLGETVDYDTSAQAWITEGSADLMAIRALEKLTPGYDSRGELQRSLDECIKLSGAGKPLSGASERGEVRANYTCGAMLLLAAEASLRKHDASADALTWLRALIDKNRADGIVGQADWLAQFRAASGDDALTEDARAFIEKGAADPRAFFARFFAKAGVAIDDKGEKLVLP